MNAPTCRHIGGQRVIPYAKVEDLGQYTPGQLRLRLAFRDPDAVISKEPIRARLRASVCCDCSSRVDFFIQNPERVWDAYRQTPPQRPPM